MIFFKKQLKITRGGVNCGTFRQFAEAHKNWFLYQYTYSRENLETAYKIKFCPIVIRGQRLNFKDEPVWGKNVLFVGEKSHKTGTALNYVRISKEIIK